MCSRGRAGRPRLRQRPYPVMTRAERRAGLDLMATWALEQEAAANRQVIAIMRKRLAAGEQCFQMRTPLSAYGCRSRRTPGRLPRWLVATTAPERMSTQRPGRQRRPYPPPHLPVGAGQTGRSYRRAAADRRPSPQGASGGRPADRRPAHRHARCTWPDDSIRHRRGCPGRTWSPTPARTTNHGGRRCRPPPAHSWEASISTAPTTSATPSRPGSRTPASPPG